MRRLGCAVFLVLLPAFAQADCATYQQAYKVPPPASGQSEDPDGPLGCTRDALAMFEINAVAAQNARPVGDLPELHGAWLSDAVLGGVLGLQVSGQELLVVEAGEADSDLSVTQYWLKAASPRGAGALWSEDGAYLGVMSKAQLSRLDESRFEVPFFGQAITYGSAVLEFERSYELFVKAQLNHFELPLALARHEDVLVLKGQRRDPLTRQVSEYTATYTRVAPGAAETALAFAAVFEQSQIRFTDCLAHQITAGQGPLFSVLGEAGLDGLTDMMLGHMQSAIRRESLSKQMRQSTDPEEMTRLRDAMQAEIEGFIAFSEDPQVRSLTERVRTSAVVVCPPLR